MPRPRNAVPTYRKHRKIGRAVVDVYRHDGRRTTLLLPGPHGSAESREEYERILGLLRANAGRIPSSYSIDITVAELGVRFLADRFPEEASCSNEQGYRQLLKLVGRLHGRTMVREFDSVALEECRKAMVSGAWMTDAERKKAKAQRRPIGWCRKFVNKNVSSLRSVFRWGVTKKLVPAAIVTDLACLPPLKRGVRGVRESAPVRPVEPETIDATLEHLPPMVKAMVQVQLLSGVRPGELCKLRVRDLDMSGPVWLYTPGSHKTERHDVVRTIAFGPRSQAILRAYLTMELDGFVFSPARQRQLLQAAKRDKRQSKVQPSQQDRSKPEPKRRPGLRFTARGYNRAIARGCVKAGVQSWHAHQLRHTASLLVRREKGAEAARAMLGHKQINMTAHYGGLDQELAVQVALAMG